MKAVRFIALLLVIIGALNWGFVGFFGVDVVARVFGSLTNFIYMLVGLAGLYGISFVCKSACCGCKCGSNCNCCKK